VDRINIGFAALTMNKELAMTSQQFGFAAGFAWQRNGRFMASQMSGDTVAAGEWPPPDSEVSRNPGFDSAGADCGY